MCDAGWLAMLACATLTCLLCFLLPSYPTHAYGSILILQRVSDWQRARHVVYAVCPCCPHVCCSLAMLACATLTCLLCFLLPSYPTHAYGSILILQVVSDWQRARHVVYAVCPCCPHVCCSLAMLACATLTCLLCFLLPSYPTHAYGSILILQVVSDWQRARNVVLVVCPCCPHVCCSLAMLACGHLTSLHLFSFALLPHTCIWIHPDSAGGE